MILYLVRLTAHPHIYVGKKNPMYAFSHDDHFTMARGLQLDAQWFVPEPLAKVFNAPKDVRWLMSAAADATRMKPKVRASLTFNAYEIVKLEDGRQTILDATDFYHKRVE